MRNRWRPLFIAALCVVVLLVSSVLGVYAYVASGAANTRIVDQLEAVLGMPVQVGAAGLRPASLVLSQVKIYGKPGDAVPWLVAGNLSADLSPWQMVRGEASPRSITLTDVMITLDFDAESRLQTPLTFGKHPGDGALPAVHLESTAVTLRQAGRPPFVVTGLRGSLVSQDQQLVLSGTVADPSWGNWEAGGTLDRTTNAATLSLKSAKVHASRTSLEGLPFVPRSVWNAVQADGEAAVDLSLRLASPGPDLHYRIVVQPHAAQVFLPTAALQIDGTEGELIIEDGQAQIRNASGRTADGTIRGRGDLDFRHPDINCHFVAELENVEIQRLPARWKLPALIEGRLGGQADLRITLTAAGQLQTAGTGEGVITDAHLDLNNEKIPSDPIRLKLTAAPGGFQFQQSKKEAASMP